MEPTLILILALSFLPPIVWVSFFFAFDRGAKEPRAILVLSFLWGILSVVPVTLLHELLSRTGLYESLYVLPFLGVLGVTLVQAMLFALVEEMAKHGAAISVMAQYWQARSERLDVVLYSISVALGFAFLENLIYLYGTYMSTMDAGLLWQVFLSRSLLTMLAHALFSGVFGLFYLWAKEASAKKPVTITDIRKHFAWSAVLFRTSRSTDSEQRSEEAPFLLVWEGLWAAVLLHAGFNLLYTLEIFSDWVSFLGPLYLGLLGIWLLQKVRSIH